MTERKTVVYSSNAAATRYYAIRTAEDAPTTFRGHHPCQYGKIISWLSSNWLARLCRCFLKNPRIFEKQKTRGHNLAFFSAKLIKADFPIVKNLSSRFFISITNIYENRYHRRFSKLKN
eukprot:SAG11_NODE_389_length_9870_cov_7.646812_5_plen_119_part_00